VLRVYVCTRVKEKKNRQIFVRLGKYTVPLHVTMSKNRNVQLFQHGYNAKFGAGTTDVILCKIVEMYMIDLSTFEKRGREKIELEIK
jgi:esterase/lipase superfamily enzyme